MTWGATKQEDGSVLLTAEYADWMASWIEDSCHCGPHLDHMDCIAEIEALIKLLRLERA